MPSSFGGHGPLYPMAPALFFACRAPEGTLPSPTPVTAGSMLNTTQCTNVPPCASGSSTTSASAFALSGTPSHAIGGDTPLPSHVYICGTRVPFAKAALDTCIEALTCCVASFFAASEPEGFEPQAASTSTSTKPNVRATATRPRKCISPSSQV